MFDNYEAKTEVDGHALFLSLIDTEGVSEYAKLRPLQYPNTDVFLLCYSVADPKSLENIQQTWSPEVSKVRLAPSHLESTYRCLVLPSCHSLPGRHQSRPSFELRGSG